MSGYASKREVREVIAATLRQEGRDPAGYNITGIMRDAFYDRGRGYGYGAAPEAEWNAAVAKHQRKTAAAKPEPSSEAAAGPGAVCWEYQAGEAPIRLSFSIKVF